MVHFLAQFWSETYKFVQCAARGQREAGSPAVLRGKCEEHQSSELTLTVDSVVEILDAHGVARRTRHILHRAVVTRVQEPFKRIVLSRCNRPYVMRVLGLSRSFDHLLTLIIRLIDQVALV